MRTILGKILQKHVCFRHVTHLASPNQEFPKWASPFQEFLKWASPFQEFLKRAGPNQEFLKVNSSPSVCKNYRACVNVSSGTSLDS